MEPEEEPRCAHCHRPAESGGQYCNRVCRSAHRCRIERGMVHCEEKFRRYQWIRELAKGIGNYGVIYLCYNLETGREVVLKVQVYVDTFPSAREKRDNEMLVACRLSGRPGCLELYDYWICDVWPEDRVFRRAAEKRHLQGQRTLFYMEMQLARGTLQDLIDDETPLSAHTKYCFLFELLATLELARRDLGFVHGDLQPNNIFFVLDTDEREYQLPDDETGEPRELSCRSVFRPMLGDFGNSALGVVDPARYEADLQQLFASMDEWGIVVRYDQRRKQLVRDSDSYLPLLHALHRSIVRQEREMEVV